jgi:dUTP pyrophosphatase
MIHALAVAKIMPDALLPVRNNPTDAGLDLLAYYDYVFEPEETKVTKTGVAILMPEHYAGLIFPNSKNDYLIGAGVIDPGYAGEIKIKVVNTTMRRVAVYYGQPIAQMVIVPIFTPELKEIDHGSLFDRAKRISDRGKEGGINR